MTPLFEAILRISVEAAVLCVLVLIARLIIGRRPGRMLTVLYALIAVRLIVPIVVSSPLSVLNMFREPQQQIVAVFNDKEPDMINNLQTPVVATASHAQPPKTAAVSDTVSTPAVAAPESSPEPLTMADIAALVWALGMVAMAGTILTGNALFLRRIRRNRYYDDPHFITLLNDCKQSLGLRRNICVICASETGTAAVYGVFRPVLLISPVSFERLSEAQQRHVLLHELSHIRRRDTLVCAGATVLNIMHWFNPLVWLVFALMRRDIEVQCDAHVFRGLPGAERTDYAGTLLKLAGPVQTPRLASALFISKANIKRRIVMIIKYKKKSALFTAVALLLTVLVAVTGCTTAVDLKAEAAPAEPSPLAVAQTTPELNIDIPDNYKLLSSYKVDYSACADDTARVNNTMKAAELLNGVMIEYADINDNPNEFWLMKALGDVTVENGWQAARWYGWNNADWNEISCADEIGRQKILQTLIQNAQESEPGGGIDIVAAAVWCAAHDAKLDEIVCGPEEGTTNLDGDMSIGNSLFKDGVLLSVSAENNAVTVSLYGPDDSVAAAVNPELMASFKIDNSPIPHNRDLRMKNIQIAADMLTGTVIKPDETISLNDILGPRNQETAETVGWTLASGIKDGSYTTNIGGGITAVATALYNAAVRAELDIAEVEHCSIPYDLVNGGLDATISTDGPDLKIKNPYDSDVTIEAKLEGTLLTVNVYGPPMGYRVDFLSEKAADENNSPVITYVYNTAIAPDGTTIAPGAVYEYTKGRSPETYTIYKVCYDGDGKETKREIYAMATYGVEGVVYVNGPDPAIAFPDSEAKPTPAPTPMPSAKVKESN